MIGVHLFDNDAAGTGLVPDPVYPAYVHGDIIVRQNRVRYLDGAFQGTYLGYGVHVKNAKNALVFENVVESAPADPVRAQRCGGLKFFNNRSPATALIEGYDPSSGATKRYNDLETDAEFGLVMSFIKHR